jgi:hypothetical protein
MHIPEQGQLVSVRNRLFVVRDVDRYEAPQTRAQHRVSLECLDDDRLGETSEVIWEAEINPPTLEARQFPE